MAEERIILVSPITCFLVALASPLTRQVGMSSPLAQGVELDSAVCISVPVVSTISLEVLE